MLTPEHVVQGLPGACGSSIQQLQLDVHAADLVLLGWALPHQAQACTAALQTPRSLLATGGCLQRHGDLPVPSTDSAFQLQQAYEKEPVAARCEDEEGHHAPHLALAPGAAASAGQTCGGAAKPGQGSGAHHAALPPLDAPPCHTRPGRNMPAEQTLVPDQCVARGALAAAVPPIAAPYVPSAEQVLLGAGWRRKKRKADGAIAQQPDQPHPLAAVAQVSAHPPAACLAPAQPRVRSMRGAAHAHAAAGPAAGDAATQAAPHEPAPSWLQGQLCRLAQSSSAAALHAELAPGALSGRSVAFALLEAFESDGETVCAGLHVGRCGR